MSSTSVSLIQRVCTSMDDHSWRRFVALYTPLLYFWARRTGCQPNDAADLVQEVFAVLIDRLPSFRYDAKGSFRGWLRTVAHNCWHNYRRRLQLPQDADARIDQIPADQPDEHFWEAEYQAQFAKNALALIQADFAPQTWQAFWQTTVEDQSTADTAQSLGLSVASVYAARSRVLQRLRQEFDGLME